MLTDGNRPAVIFEGFLIVGQVCTIFVGQSPQPVPHFFLGLVDEMGSHRVSDASRPRMKHDPDMVLFIQTKFNEMVSGPESTEVGDRMSAIELL